MPQDNDFASRRVGCCGSNGTTKGAYYAFSSRCPREPAALLTASQPCRGGDALPLPLGKSIVAAPPYGSKTQVSKKCFFFEHSYPL